MACSVTGLPLARSLALVLIATAATLSLAADGSGQPAAGPLAQHPRLIARTFAGPRAFRVESPGARESRAWTDEQADALGALGATISFELADRVTVRTGDPGRLRAWAGRRGLRVSDGLAKLGFVSVRTTSVSQSLDVAEALASAEWVSEAYVDLTQPIAVRDVPNDPFLSLQWHLINDVLPGVDARVRPAWEAGYSGAGVTIGIVEPSAWQADHPDLIATLNAEASQPGGAVGWHATSVAGVAAARGFNGRFGVGAAFGASLATQRTGSDEQIAEALSFRVDLNAIKNNSWGPPDDALIRSLPSVVRAALEHAVTEGRDGRGTIVVWAAGNGGGSSDRVDYDPYASSRHTIAVNAITDQDMRTLYDERGCSVLLCAHSGGGFRNISTVTSSSGWTNEFGGTSSAAPLVSGVVALMLEANPNLTWRDVQHVLVESARHVQPSDPDWEMNGGGRRIHYHYGFGALDASVAVPLAADWTNVPHEVTVDTGMVPVETDLPDNVNTGVTMTVDVPEDIRIESVELVLNVETAYVGDLRIVLTSPSGLSSILAHTRMDPQDDLVSYPFTSLRHWGELSAGTWSVTISDRRANNIATWHDFRLIFHGTPPCLGDLDGNGFSDLADVMALLASYGLCAAEAGFAPEADFDNSGCIDLADLSRLLEAFGGACEQP